MFDVHDILDANRPQIEEAPAPPIAKRGPKPKGPKPMPIVRRKPEDYAPINPNNAYKQVRANLSIKKPRNWDLVEFTNSARKDDLILKHWQRVDSSQQDYPFAKYNRKIDDHIPKYNESEYNSYLKCDQWTKEETDYLMQMCTRFDLRFMVIHDRWDRNRFKTERSVEDLKERYYFVHNQLEKYRVSTTSPPKLKMYDSPHERKRKNQLLALYNRTKEQIEEEQNLINELKKIDQKKKERERRMHDLQKNLDAGRSAPDHHKHRHESTPASVGRPSGSGMRGMPGRRPGRGAGRPSRDSMASVGSTSQILGSAASLLDLTTMSIKFPDFKTSGASLRSQRLKLPTSLGGKKTKGLEGMLTLLGIDLYPMPTESICQSFNELRGDLLLLYELKMSYESTNFEINSMLDQIKTLKPDLVVADALADTSAPSTSHDASSRDISDVIDINAANTPGRKRKAALEQSNVLRKLKKTL